jgi:hypothetical protein
MLKLILENKSDGVTLTDFREIRRELGKIEPALRREFDKSIRDIAKPAQNILKGAIPTTPPLSGFNHNGRTAWRASNPKSVRIYKPKSGRNSGKLTATLVGLRVMSAAVTLADMAGRSGAYFGGKGVTRQYVRNGKTMTHKISQNSGKQFSYDLNVKLNKRPSRFAWPSIESKLSDIEKEISKVIQKASVQLNGRLFK